MEQNTATHSWYRTISGWISAHPLLTMLCVCLPTVFLGWGQQETLASLLPLTLVPAAVLIGFWLDRRQQLTDGRASFLILLTGWAMRLSYILVTPYYVRQHDVGRFDEESGHAAYMTYLYENLHLPDFDVREIWQFYHPPLHHGISALWMRLLTFCGVPFEQAGESVQILTFTYSCMCMVLFLEILRHFGLKGHALLLPLAVIAMHPTFFLLAGSINNDMLCITFMMASVLLTLRWFRKPQLRTILLLAVTIGLGMMTKLSGWMIAPAAALAFLIVLIRNRKKPLPYLGQFALFGLICVPLGLGWGVRNLIGWGVPITYVPMLSDQSSQFVGDIPIWQRLFDLAPKQWLYVYDCFEMYGQSYNEYNPFFGLMKTAMFDELINPQNYPAVRFVGEALFFSNLAVALAAAAAMVIVFIKKRNFIGWEEKLMLGTSYGITLISYYSFCIGFAHVCTQNIRYATPLIFIGALFLGIWMQHKGNGKASRLFNGLLLWAVPIFCVCSYLVYSVVCRG